MYKVHDISTFEDFDCALAVAIIKKTDDSSHTIVIEDDELFGDFFSAEKDSDGSIYIAKHSYSGVTKCTS